MKLLVGFVLQIIIGTFAKETVHKADGDLFPLNIIHLNDFHARFEETNLQTSACKEGERCIGGYARVVSKVKQLLVERLADNPIYLNAADNFQGTLWYNVHRWNGTSHFLNKVVADAMTIGNHEFDHGVAGVVPFIDAIESPIVICNVDDSEEPTFAETKYTKSHVIKKYGRKIGVIGVILRTTNNIAQTGKLKFSTESTAVREEATRLKEEEGVDIIIVLSHCGLDTDRFIARNAGPDIDIIVGGHSHSFLWSGENLPDPAQNRAGTYPIIEIQNDGHRVLIVQAYAYAKYLGDITVYFDDAGIIQQWKGEPILLDESVVPDPETAADIALWKVEVDATGARKVGSVSSTYNSNCYVGECAMGSLITDSFVNSQIKDAEEGAWTYAALAITNPGGVRGPLKKGDLTFADLVTTTPFENTLDSMEVQGKYIKEALEYGVRYDSPSVMQVSGIKVVYNMTAPINSRILTLDVLCRVCDVPKYEPINSEEWYRIVMPSFIALNGDNFAMIRDNRRNHKVGVLDIDALTEYVEQISPIGITGVKGRITLLR